VRARTGPAQGRLLAEVERAPLLRDLDGIACAVLREFSLEARQLRAELRNLRKRGTALDLAKGV
jgi:hypothetical protein